MSGEYPFAEWQDAQLALRNQELAAVSPLKHGPERAATISRELSHLAFELYQRQRLTVIPDDARWAKPTGNWRFPPDNPRPMPGPKSA